MGLLTDPSAGQGRIIKLLLKYYAKLCFGLYIFGIAYFCLLASPQLNSNTYFSENALLPGLVKSEFKEETAARLFYEELQDEIKKYDDGIPYPWLLAKFRQMGLDTYTHNFTLNYPLGSTQKFTGKNVYAIIRAARAASTEALILSVPYRPPLSVHLPTAPSIATMLAFAKFAVKEKYWAKDLIFLVTEHEQLGMQAWLEAYHGVQCGRDNVLIAGDMKGRAGAIQAAINLELHDVQIGQFDIKIEGVNGQLPNLDLFNLAARMCTKEGIKLTFKDRTTEKPKNIFKDFNLSLHFLSNLPKKISMFFQEWWSAFPIYMNMVSTQATGIPNGNHGLYYRFGIQALTLEGYAPTTYRENSAGFYTQGRILEGTFRSLNNLLERFHQSFFFYLLSTTDRYISIGLYIPAICLLVATVFIKSYAKWCQIHKNDTNEKEIKESDSKNNKLTDEELKTIEEKFDKVSDAEWRTRFEIASRQKSVRDHENINLGHTCLVLMLSHIFGFLLKDFPKLVSQIGANYGYQKDAVVYYSFGIVSLLSITLPIFLKRPTYKSMVFLNIMALIELGTSLICISMYNISLGMCLAAVFIPLALLINPTTCGMCSKLQKLMWIVAHPFVLVTISVMVFTFITFPNETLFDILSRGIDATQKAVTFSILDAMIYGNWLFNVIVTILVPNWLCFWYVTFSYKTQHEKQE